MKIAVVAANGAAGQHIVEEAVNRGHEVTAFVRSENKSKAQNAVVKDLYEITSDDLKGFNVVVDAFGNFNMDQLDQHSTSLMHLADQLSHAQARLLVVGGAGSLYTDKSEELQVKDEATFPDVFRPLAQAMSDALDLLRKRTDVKWTYLSPAEDFDAEGPRTGSYVLAGEVREFNSEGKSYISYADYAIAMNDLAEKANHIHERVSVYTA
ncbi:NAD(P)-dependent oxidoreductase [Floricoccus penangensis]|uniref:NAD(P)-dependent oxidoreductase n=1 Tax=Floricoccus penangensis TaxID=1859475 RepID=UPI00203C2AF4|nr:NAD(P)H-binding protein [Floricoccus penangensis]URZ86543.1 NAD(P)H-binding protein [Floricoccus penangensis]